MKLDQGTNSDLHAKSIAAEAAELKLALDAMQLKIEDAAKDNSDPSFMNQEMIELEAGFELHHLRIQQKIQDVIKIFNSSGCFTLELNDEQNAYRIKELLKEDFQFIMRALLQDSDADTRRMSAFIIGKSFDPDCLKALAEIGMRDIDSGVREMSASGLEGVSDPECIKALCDLGLKDTEWEVRIASSQSLEGVKDPEMQKMILERGLESEHSVVCCYVIRALAGTTDVACIDRLIDVARSHENLTVRMVAREVLSSENCNLSGFFDWARHIGIRIVVSHASDFLAALGENISIR